MSEQEVHPRAHPEPIAIVGLSCRLPGAPDPGALWRLLAEGREAVAEPPAHRGLASLPRAGLLDEVDRFDTGLFGLSPREAAAADPQQLLTAELGWEALEDAGIAPDRLRGAPVGVFVGGMADDHALRRHRSGDPAGAHTMAGSQRSMIANRLSHLLGLRGDSVVVDTGQSSSLVSVALACESLRAGRVRTAIAAGVGLILDDASSEAPRALGALSPTGRCRTFDAAADGYARGEGGAAVVLRPLADALAAGDRVHAVVRGAAVGHTGGAAALTAPDADGQADLLRRACADAGVDPRTVWFVELHGTGTPAGDPVEARALGAVHGAGRPAHAPLLVGSVKTNIGHLEGAAGIAGLLKAVLSLRERALPPGLNFTRPHPGIPLEELGLRVHTGGPAPAPDRAPLTAGVSSFGLGGTGCHLVLEGPPAAEPAPGPAPDGRSAPLVLSAADPEALRGQAARLRDHLARRPAAPLDTAFTLAAGRAALPHRIALPGDAPRETLERLDRAAAGEVPAGARAGRAREGAATAFVFTGTPPAPGAADRLYAAEPAFARAVDLVRDAVAAHGGAPEGADPVAGGVPEGAGPPVAGGASKGPDPVSGSVSEGAVPTAGEAPAGTDPTVGGVPEDADSALGGTAAALAALAWETALYRLLLARGAVFDAVGHRPGGGAGAALAAGRLDPAGAVRALLAGEDPGAADKEDAPAGVAVTAGPRGPLVDGEAPLACDDAVLGTLAAAFAAGSRVDWEKAYAGTGAVRTALPTYAFRRRPLRDRAQARPAPAPGGAPAPGTATPAGAPAPGDRARALRTVADAARAVLGGDALLLPDAAFRTQGFDSVASLELRNVLVEETGLDLPPTLVYDLPTPRAVADRLAALSGDRAAGPDGERAAPGPAATGPDGDDPVVVVGMGCRYPGGVRTPEDLWLLVSSGADAITPFPDDRGWDADSLYDPEPGTPGRSATRHGGFLHDAAEFDADFFGISPREAAAMDPQQRVLLEVAWEALERAGTPPERLRGDRVGVFVGAMAQEYGPPLHRTPPGHGGHMLTGGSVSVASGRLSYVFGFRGPSLTVDTACSSSLVALHQAVRSLRQGECDAALAAGVAVMSSPGMFVEFSMQRGLAPDGRCKPFSAAADGTAWGEGAGVLVLERLSRARALGHRVLAVVRGSAVNSDGDSNGLTAPSGPAQEEVVAAALADAGLEPRDVQAVEAHGTGTVLGDPVEARALQAAYGADADAGPLWLGSVKANLGHTQAAAGMAGVIKTVQALHHGVLPRSLHADTPSPHVDWSAGRVRLLSSSVPWRPGGGVRRAGVSSFGISGTNAHVIVEQPPAPDAAPGDGTTTVWSLSARDAGALRAQAARLRDHVADRPGIAPAALGRALERTRSRFAHRAAVVGADRAALLEGLAALAEGRPSPHTVQGRALEDAPVVFVFPGQGSQWPGMAAGLLEESEVFRTAMRACADALAPHTDWSLTDVVRGLPGAPGLDRVDVVQPALWAVMVSLARVWREAGVEPAAVVGHSQGEIAAACAAGILDLSDAAKVVALRSRAIAEIAGGGGMASVPLSEERTRERLAASPLLHVAALNGPASTVVAGDADALDAFVAACRRDRVHARRVDVDYASHTPAMESLHERLLDLLGELEPRTGGVPLYSTVSEGPVDPLGLDADYWYCNLRNTVRFEPTVRRLIEDGHGVFIEMSPHPVLTGPVDDTIAASGRPGRALGTLRREEGGAHRLAAAFAEARVAGVAVEWDRGPDTGPLPELPTYAFQRSRHWLDPAPDPGAPARDGHPLLDGPVEVAGTGRTVFTARVDPARHRWAADHVIGGEPLLPGAATADLAAAAGAALGLPLVAELVLHAPVRLDGPTEVQVGVDPAGADGSRPLTVHARPAGGAWLRAATGTLARDTAAPDTTAPLAWPPPGRRADPDEAYAALAERGYGYGPALRGVRELWLSATALHARVRLPAGGADGHLLHPALLDAALHPLLMAEEHGAPAGLPFLWSGVRAPARCPRELLVRVEPLGPGEARVTLAGTDGAPVARIDRVALRPAAAASGGGDLHHVVWEPPEPPREPSGPPRCAVVGPGDLGLAGAERHPDLDALLDRDPRVPLPERVVLDLRVPRDADREPLPAAALARTNEALALLQRWLGDERTERSRLVAVTAGAAPAGTAPPDPAAAALWGLLRCARAEHPGRWAAVDLEPGRDVLPAAALDTAEPEVAVRGGGLLVPRLAAPAAGRLTPPGEGEWHLETDGRGGAEGLSAAAHTPVPPPPGHVRVRVRAAGLNFRDVLIGLGVYPDPADIGTEAAGVVAEAAPGTGLAPGDRVMGVFPGGALGTEAVTDHRLLAPVPPGWSDADAAAVPIAYLTARHALVDLAGLRAGEKVLVHAAAGGVGTAAVRLARHLGAEVFATAGPEKWGALHRLGLDDRHVAGSRTLDFEDAFCDATGGEGVDVVLNSLAGEFTDASLRLLAEGGRFVEMGKTDLRDAESTGVEYHAFDLLALDPDRIAAALAELGPLLADGTLAPPPVTVFPLHRAPEAFRLMQGGGHTGKLVLTPPPAPDPRGTVLVTGGTGTLGGLVARRLVERHGVRRLLLVGRRGADAEGAAELRRELAGLGAHVDIAACDAADRAALARVVGGIPGAHPLTAVVHAAGVLDDAGLARLTPEQVGRVFRAKADAAWNLHELTRGLPLTAFVLFSSVAGVVGTAGQAGYGAANAFLDSLARTRRGLGLPASALAWGLWERSSGMTGHMGRADVARLARRGIAPVSTEEGLELFDRAWALDEPHLVPARITDAAVRTSPGGPPAILRGLLGGAAAPPPAPRDPEPAAPAAAPPGPGAAAGGPGPERSRLGGLVLTHVATVLGHDSPDRVDPERTFEELGFDSLTSVELRNRLRSETGIGLPATVAFDYPTVRELTDRLLAGDAG
ncbi:Acyl transferase domain-containing protein [Nocardiopsis flavescens]|uniref:Acyl transferase domain-containing protein n=1 Tax=Nocardiopsis flavescens TaxID=758803 RepID=A0A1M6BKC1_9ACTN|nr:type I polyketide synthase [Nocardiopsis flavescens]SHI49116.1 Acyl transferase domain-containing protein [Nocardiopsis flavescens]